MHLGEVIKKYREDNSLSMQSFADKCELSKGYIAMLERNVNSKTGEPVVPSIETFMKVAAAMHISLSSLVEQVDENQPVLLEYNAERLDDISIDSSQKTASVDLDSLDKQIIDIFKVLPDDKKSAALDYLNYLKGTNK